MAASFGPKATLAGGLLAGLGASACCLGPLLLLSLGIGGAWISHLTALEPYRPVFLGVMALCLAAAYWQLYRRPAACAAKEGCGAQGSCKAQRVAFWVLLPVVLLLAASPWIVPLLER